MIGAIIGDIVGSRFEHHNSKTKDFNLFSPECRYTDDSVMSLAICEALLACKGNYANLSEQAADRFSPSPSRIWWPVSQVACK